MAREANQSVLMHSYFHRRTLFALLLAVVVVVTAIPFAHAADETLQAIIDRIEHDNDCKVLSVQEMEHGKRKIYVIKMLTKDGRVKVVQVRASD
ncbi:MAG: hypothetical protein WAV67_09095 [Dokdonella sp.]